VPRLLLGLVVAALASCSGTANDPDAEATRAKGEPHSYVECVVPRPEACTRDYRPVCGLRDTGIRCVTEPCDSWETRTYGNACSACADGSVYGWRPGECEVEGIVRRE
jgi:hypothetical protein